MVSHKFSILSNVRIAEFMGESAEDTVSDDLLDSVESISDLWLLANIKETYEKDVERDCDEDAFEDGNADSRSYGGN